MICFFENLVRKIVRFKMENFEGGALYLCSFPCHSHNHSDLCNFYPVALDTTKRQKLA